VTDPMWNVPLLI